MYLRYFGLNETPFSITPDPAFVFLSPRHRDALAHLMYGIGQGGSGGGAFYAGEYSGDHPRPRITLPVLEAGDRALS